MQTEFHLTGKKKDVYPSKKTINLYYAEDKTTRPSTIALYVLFIAVVFLALAKILVYDLTADLLTAKKEVAKKEAYINQQLEVLQENQEISAQYSRYTFSYLKEDEVINDRADILEMLEEAVFSKVNIKSVMITDDVVAIEFEGPNMEDAAAILTVLEGYEIVESVNVNTASLDDGYSTTMVITLVGGEQ